METFTKIIKRTVSTIPWTSITGKPTEFNPAAHTQPISSITNLQTTLDGKADKVVITERTYR